MATYPYSLTITNPGAESGVTGWTNDVGTLAAVAAHPDALAMHGGSNCFRAGATATTRCHQDITLPAEVLSDVDEAILIANFAGYHAGFSGDADSGALGMVFLDGSDVQIGEQINTSFVDSSSAAWTEREMSVLVPATTRKIQIIQHGLRAGGTNLDSYWDDFTLELLRPAGSGGGVVVARRTFQHHHW